MKCLDCIYLSELNKEISDLKKEFQKKELFVDFFKNELPDVYKTMWKEYCKKQTNYSQEKKDKFDRNGEQLKTGEQQRKNGYHYTYLEKNTEDGTKKRKYIYAKTLNELRIKEMEVKNKW